MATLYEMTENARYLYELLQAEEIDEQTIADTLEAMGIDEKLESYGKIIRQMQADADMFKAELDRLSVKKKSADNAVERMKKAVKDFMEASGQEKAKAGAFSFYLATTQAVNITDEKRIPADYLIPQPDKIDRNSIKKALKDGVEVAGAELVTNVGVRMR